MKTWRLLGKLGELAGVSSLKLINCKIMCPDLFTRTAVPYGFISWLVFINARGLFCRLSGFFLPLQNPRLQNSNPIWCCVFLIRTPTHYYNCTLLL